MHLYNTTGTPTDVAAKIDQRNPVNEFLLAKEIGSGGRDKTAYSPPPVAAHGGLVGHHLEVIAPVASTNL